MTALPNVPLGAPGGMNQDRLLSYLLALSKKKEEEQQQNQTANALLDSVRKVTGKQLVATPSPASPAGANASSPPGYQANASFPQEKANAPFPREGQGAMPQPQIVPSPQQNTALLAGAYGQDVNRVSEKLGSAFRKQQKAQAEINKASVDAAEEIAKIQSQAEQAHAAYISAKEQREQRRIASMKEAARPLKEAKEKLENFEIKPGNVFKKGTTGEKIGAAIAIALGAMGAAFTGGPNQALQIIQQAAEDDVEAQYAEREKILQQIQLGKENVQSFKDEFARLEQQKKEDLYLKLKAAEMQVLSTTKGLESQTAKALGQQLMGKLQERQAVLLNDTMRGWYNDAVKMEALQSRQEMQRTSLQLKQAEKRRSITVPGLEGTARSPKAAEEATKKYGDYLTIKDTIEDMREFREEVKAVDKLNPLQQREASQLLARYIVKYKNFENFGAALTDSEAALVRKAALGGEDVTLNDWLLAKKLISKLVDTTDKDMKNFLKPRGLRMPTSSLFQEE